jgi:DNA (cytosine-5)-methyltransferase 1
MIDFVSVNGGGNCSIAAARDAMGIDWMNKGELNEAIPPAYTEHIGKQLMKHLRELKKCEHQDQKNGFANSSLRT